MGVLTVGVGAGLAGCSGLGSAASPVGQGAIAAAESARATSGRVRKFALQARPVEVDLGGRIVSTWAYGNTILGTAFRASMGDRVQVAFGNDLPQATSVHWHGLAIRNDMDGVPGVTTPEVAPGGSFDFDFVVPDAGTYWFHPHSGLQLDRGLYAPFIIDDPDEPVTYEREWVVVLDDWTDGVGSTPEQIYARLTSDGAQQSGGMDMGGMDMGGMDGGDVDYPLYVVNGGVLEDPDVLSAKPGARVRLRIINAAADTIFNVALAGHDLRVTHTDGYRVTPVTTPLIQIGMGERYDAIVTLGDGVFPLVADPVGKQGSARALVRTSGGRVPAPSYRPRELDAYPLTVDALTAAAGSALPVKAPDTTQNLVLAGSMGSYVWTINGRTYDDTVPLTVRQGQTGRFRIQNQTMMPHPLHLHGHTFQIGSAGGSGPRKDTVVVPAMGAVSLDLVADNPGQWMVHCHNAYHAEAGMMTRLEYVV